MPRDFFQQPAAKPVAVEPQPATNPSDFHLWRSVEEAAAEDQRKLRSIDWLIPDWIERGDAVILAGDPGVGKSLMAVSICVSLAARRQILGMWDPVGSEPMVSVILDLENRVNPMKRRISRIAEGLGVDHSKIIRGPLHPLHLRGRQIFSQPTRGAVVSAMQDIQPDLVVLDTIMSATDQPNLGPQAGVRFIRDRVYAISRQVGCEPSWLLVHHMKKPDPQKAKLDLVGDLHQVSGGGFVGSSDGSILVQEIEGHRVVSNPKQRHQKNGGLLYLHMDDGGSPQAPLKLWLTDEAPQGDDALALTAACLAFIDEQPEGVVSKPALVEFVQGQMNTSQRTAKRRLEGLIDLGLLEIKGKGESGGGKGGRRPWLVGRPG